MNRKFFYVYLIGATVSVILLFYQALTPHTTRVNYWNLSGNILLSVALFYLAYKTYHEKKDSELM